MYALKMKFANSETLDAGVDRIVTLKMMGLPVTKVTTGRVLNRSSASKSYYTLTVRSSNPGVLEEIEDSFDYHFTLTKRGYSGGFVDWY